MWPRRSHIKTSRATRSPVHPCLLFLAFVYLYPVRHKSELYWYMWSHLNYFPQSKDKKKKKKILCVSHVESNSSTINTGFNCERQDEALRCTCVASGCTLSLSGRAVRTSWKRQNKTTALESLSVLEKAAISEQYQSPSDVPSMSSWFPLSVPLSFSFLSQYSPVPSLRALRPGIHASSSCFPAAATREDRHTAASALWEEDGRATARERRQNHTETGLPAGLQHAHMYEVNHVVFYYREIHIL